MNPYKDHKNSKICQRIEKDYLPKIFFDKCFPVGGNPNKQTLKTCNSIRKEFYNLIYTQQRFYWLRDDFKKKFEKLNDNKPLNNMENILKRLEPL